MFSTLRVYFGLGFEHILPLGTDHVLFVVGLFLLSTRPRPLVLQITTFTTAHALTLILSTYGMVTLSSRVVEPLIALSIAYVAFENVVVREFRRSRLAVVFTFGLLHGLGFAGALVSLGLPKEEFLPALLAFNLGVEAGQLAVVATAMATVGLFRHKPWYRDRIAVPASLLIGLIGLYWTVTRLGG